MPKSAHIFFPSGKVMLFKLQIKCSKELLKQMEISTEKQQLKSVSHESSNKAKILAQPSYRNARNTLQ